MAISRGGIRIPIITDFDDKAIKSFANSTQNLGRSLTRNVTLPLVALGAASVKMSLDFDKSMTKIVALVGVGASEVKQMGKETIALASEFGKTGAEAADALFFITSAGLRGADAMSVLKSSLQLSALGLGETAQVADLLTSAVNAYGASTLNAAAASDVLVAAVREGKFEASDLAGSMGKVLPIASAMGLTFGEVGGVFAALSRTGTGAAEAATQIRGILVTLAKPTKQASDQLEAMGLSAEGLRKQLREQGLLSVLETLTVSFDGNDEAITKVFGNVRALSGFLDLMGANYETTRGIINATTNSMGDSAKAMEVLEQSSGFKLNRSIATLKNSLILFGDVISPVFIRLAQAVSDFSIRFSRMSDDGKRNLIIFAAIAAAIGPVLIIMGKLILAVQGLIKVFDLLKLAFKSHPLGLAILALSLLAAAFITAYKNSETFRDVVNKVLNFLIGSFESWINAFIPAINKFIQGLNIAIKAANMVGYSIELLEEIGTVSFKRLTVSTDKASKSTKTLAADTGEMARFMRLEQKPSVDSFAGSLDNLGNSAAGPTGEGGAKKKLEKLKNVMQQIREAAVTAAEKIVSNLNESLRQAQGELDEANRKFNAFRDSIAGTITGILNFGKAADESSFLEGLMQQAANATLFADKIKQLILLGLSEKGIQQILSAGFEAGSAIADELIAGGATMVNQVNTLVSSVESIAEQVGNFGAREFYQVGVTQGEAIVAGILAALRDAQAALQAAQVAAVTGGAVPPGGSQFPGGQLQQALWAEAVASGNQTALDLLNQVTQGGTGAVSANELQLLQQAGIGQGLTHPSKKAIGGLAVGGKPYLVGEHGPELFMPGSSGMMTPNHKLGGGYTINVYAGVGTDGMQVGRQIVDAIKRFEKQSGPVFAKA